MHATRLGRGGEGDHVLSALYGQGVGEGGEGGEGLSSLFFLCFLRFFCFHVCCGVFGDMQGGDGERNVKRDFYSCR